MTAVTAAADPIVEAVTAEPGAETAPEQDNARKPFSKRGFRRVQTPLLPKDQLHRQGRIATAAWLAFGDSERAAAFLNTHHDALDARPIALATESDAGYARVEAAMTQAAG